MPASYIRCVSYAYTAMYSMHNTMSIYSVNSVNIYDSTKFTALHNAYKSNIDYYKLPRRNPTCTLWLVVMNLSRALCLHTHTLPSQTSVFNIGIPCLDCMHIRRYKWVSQIWAHPVLIIYFSKCNFKRLSLTFHPIVSNSLPFLNSIPFPIVHYPYRYHFILVFSTFISPRSQASRQITRGRWTENQSIIFFSK